MMSKFLSVLSIIVGFGKLVDCFECYTGDGSIMRRKECPKLGKKQFTDLCFKYTKKDGKDGMYLALYFQFSLTSSKAIHWSDACWACSARLILAFDLLFAFHVVLSLWPFLQGYTQNPRPSNCLLQNQTFFD